MSLQARLLGPEPTRPAGKIRHDSLDLARRLPALVVSARQIAANVAHGVHGRRRAGMGESFWQFRPFTSGENAASIDWRRSARDHRTYVREREWEAAQTIWLWIDRSPSMAFQSSLAPTSKLDRALLLGFAAADVLVRGGERVGLHGLTRAIATRTIIERLADAIVADGLTGTGASEELPRPMPLPVRSRAVLIGDFLSDPAEISRTLNTLASAGAHGHLVLVSDPLEETFAFQGHVELRDSDSDARMRIGDAEAMRATFLSRLAAHRSFLQDTAQRLGWTVLVHRTDEAPAPALLALAAALGSADSFGGL